jgi:cytidylate kinase
MTVPLPIQITVSRQLGSGGSELGQRLAGRLGFAYLDRQILQQAARELGMSEAELAHREERIQNFWIRTMEAFSSSCFEYMISSAPLPRVITDDALIEAEQRVLWQLTAGGSCVIVGRCGFHLLAGRSRLLKVFVHASQPFRIARMMKFYGAATKAEAEEMIDSTDRDRERFVERFAGVSWYDARNYHLSIDMSLLGFDMAEEIIISLANRISEGN